MPGFQQRHHQHGAQPGCADGLDRRAQLVDQVRAAASQECRLPSLNHPDPLRDALLHAEAHLGVSVVGGPADCVGLGPAPGQEQQAGLGPSQMHPNSEGNRMFAEEGNFIELGSGLWNASHGSEQPRVEHPGGGHHRWRQAGQPEQFGDRGQALLGIVRLEQGQCPQVQHAGQGGIVGPGASQRQCLVG
ncbi:MAG: hypothetical protein ACRDS1_01370 [Pseudonocardiaceae bacterium]